MTIGDTAVAAFFTAVATVIVAFLTRSGVKTAKRDEREEVSLTKAWERIEQLEDRLDKTREAASAEAADLRDQIKLLGNQVILGQAQIRGALAYVQRLLADWVSPPDPPVPPAVVMELLADSDEAAQWWPRHRDDGPPK